jgi:hypothetical protein
MPLWLWLAGGAVLGYLLLSGPSSLGPESQNMGGVNAWTDEDWQTLWSWANKLGSTPQILGLLLFEESGMSPGAKNNYGCIGMNQFCPGTKEYWVKVSDADYLAMSPTDQMNSAIGPYWASKPASARQSARGMWWVSAWPASYVANADADAIVIPAGPSANANPIGQASGAPITAGDVDAYLARVANSTGWNTALQKIAANAPSGVDNA